MTRPPNGSAGGLARIWRALLNSIDGLASAWREEAALRQEAVLASALTVVAIALPASLTQTALLLFAVMLVVIVELLNSAVECTIDRISLDNHELSKRAKDVASAAVLLSLVNLALVWSLVIADIFTAP